MDSPEGKDLELKTSFTGYDYMIKFNNVTYKDNNKYPVNLGTFFSNLCNQVGLEAGDTNFVNSEIIITGNPFGTDEYKDITCKSVLKYIAELAGGFAKIGRDNKVYIKTIKNILNLLRVKDVHTMTINEFNKTKIKFLQNNKDDRVKDVHVMPVGRLNLEKIKYLTGTRNNSFDFTLDGNQYFGDFIKSDEWGEINAVTLSVSEMESENITLKNDKSIQDNGLIEIVIEDSPFITNQNDRITATQSLWNALESIKYLPFKADYYGYPYVDVGDTIYISDTNDKRYISYVLNHTFTYNGGFKGTIETQAITKTQSNYRVPTNSIDKRIKRVERKTDKINGIIEDVVQEQTEQGTLLSTTVQNVNSLTSSVTLLTNDNKEIKASLELKVDTKNLISEINASADAINLKAGRLIITAGNFKLDKEGNITATGGKIGGFNISSSYLANGTTSLAGANNSVYLGTNGISCGIAFKVTNTGQLTCSDANITGTITATKGTIAGFTIGENLLSTSMYGFNSKGDVLMWVGSSNPNSAFFSINRYGWTQCNTLNKNATESQICGSAYNWNEYYTDIKPHIIKIADTTTGNETILTRNYITTPELEQTSLEKIKKNIQLFNKNAIDIIKNSDIYEYNFKTEQDTDKKHIGFVIGNKYNTPKQVIARSGKGIDTYTMSSIMWKSIQQLLQRIEKLEGEN